ncbi:MAG: DUF4258 domain-containing protein [Pseudonocardia sp.]
MSPKFRYSFHARERLTERVVTHSEVEDCVLNPSVTFRTKKGNNYRAVVNGRPLRVVVAEDRDNDVEKFVVTVIVEDEDAT